MKEATMPTENKVATAIWETLRSVNVSDSNLEPANVVDALDEIAQALRQVAFAIDKLADKQG
jgi:hypothetical protein